MLKFQSLEGYENTIMNIIILHKLEKLFGRILYTEKSKKQMKPIIQSINQAIINPFYSPMTFTKSWAPIKK